MSSAKRSNKSKPVINENIANAKERSDKVVAIQTRNQSIAMINKRDSTVDRNTHKAAQLLGKLSNSAVAKKQKRQKKESP